MKLKGKNITSDNEVEEGNVDWTSLSDKRYFALLPITYLAEAPE